MPKGTQTLERPTRANANAALWSLLPDSVYLASMDKWMLRKDWRFESASGISGLVRRGFLYDNASTPALAAVFGFMPFSLGEMGPLAHDFGHRCGSRIPPESVGAVWKGGKAYVPTRKEWDEILREFALVEGVKDWKAATAYRLVRIFGRFAWNG